ncbi:DUF895 domain membrane protein, partial [Perkinsus olseni]
MTALLGVPKPPPEGNGSVGGSSPGEQMQSSPIPLRIPFLNKGYTQVLITGWICFCCPGFFNALQGLGGAGNANPSANDPANIALYACFAVFGYFGGFFFNLLGPRLLM